MNGLVSARFCVATETSQRIRVVEVEDVAEDYQQLCPQLWCGHAGVGEEKAGRMQDCQL